MLLDLCMGADTFTKVRAYLTAQDMEHVDFPCFLQLYAQHCGLTAASYSRASAKTGAVPYWVPSNDGMWIEVI